MKRLFFSIPVLALLFSACSKEKGCVKGEIIAVDNCGSFWAVHILEGPAIGQHFGAYDNVIELYNVPIASRKPGEVIYFTHARTRPENYRRCLAVYPWINYSDVERRLVQFSDAACP